MIFRMELRKHLLRGLSEISDKAENEVGEQVLLTVQRMSLKGWKNILYYITILSRPQNKAARFFHSRLIENRKKVRGYHRPT